MNCFTLKRRPDLPGQSKATSGISRSPSTTTRRSKIKKQAARYHKFVQWSNQGTVFIGRCPRCSKAEPRKGRTDGLQRFVRSRRRVDRTSDLASARRSTQARIECLDPLATPSRVRGRCASRRRGPMLLRHSSSSAENQFGHNRLISFPRVIGPSFLTHPRFVSSLESLRPFH